MSNSYATDGICHNAEPGTYGHECGKPATWLGTKPSGFAMGYCDPCKEHGAEAVDVTAWQRRAWTPAQLLDLLADALPYVSDGIDDPTNKPAGKRRAQAIERRIRAAIAVLEGAENELT